MSTFRLSIIASDHDYVACFAVMRALRPHLTDAAAFAVQARRQTEQGYRLLAAWQGDQVAGLAGYRVQENLLYGRFLYIDDLIAISCARRQGLGGVLIGAMQEEARRQGCGHLVLDTALSNGLAQRFYFRHDLLPKGLHFSQAI